MTETEIATHGAVEGSAVGEDVWTSRRLPPTGWNNVEQYAETLSVFPGALRHCVLYSPRQQETTIYVGSHNVFKGLAQRSVIYESLRYFARNLITQIFSRLR